MLAASDSFAVEATDLGPGPAGQGVSPAVAGKGQGPWAKAGSTLRRVFAAHSAYQQSGGAAPFDPGNPSIQMTNGLILVDAVAAGDGAVLLTDLRGLGLQNATRYGAVVSGYIPLGLLGRAVELDSLRGISASLKPETNNAVDPTFGLVHDRRGAIAMNVIASEADPQTYTGAGIKVGVLSDTFNNNGHPDYDGDGIAEPPATNADDDLLNGDLPGSGAYVALHTPGAVDDDDHSPFAANGTSGSNTTAGDPLEAGHLGASIRFNPASFYEEPITAVVTYPDAEQYTIGTQPFTIEMWARFETTSTDGLGPVLASHYSSFANNRSWFLLVSGPSDPMANSLSFWATPDGTGGSATQVDLPWSPVADTWYHIAVTRDDQSDLRMFVDGSQIGSTVNFPVDFFDSTAPFRISSFESQINNNRPFDGRIEDFRFVVGEALYTSNFTPAGPLSSTLPPSAGPTTTVLDDTGDPGIDEGRAMMQLIHDVAPDASVAFHTAFNGMADFAQGIQDLADDGADVIVDDIIYFAEPMFQDGIIAQAVDTVVAQGKAYFSSAGNAAQHSYESPFVSAGEPLTVGSEDRGTLHDFDPGPGTDFLQSVTIPAGTTFTAVLQWDQPFASNCPGCPGSQNDADIYLVKGNNPNNLQIVTSSISDNMASGEPVEIIQFANPGGFFGEDFSIMITHYDVPTPQHPQPGPPPDLMKYVWFGQSSITVNDYTTDSATSYGHANAAGAGAVGAAYYLETPAFGVSPPQRESYSSRGGVPILFDVQGNSLGVPGPRLKPQMVAPDGTNTTFFFRDTSTDDVDEAPDTFPNFFGTSAAAPHAAAVAALMLEANPALTPGDIYSILQNTAVDMGPAGFDFDTGYGLIDATAAIAQATGGNLVPVAVNDDASTNQNTLVSIPVLTNDALGDQPTVITQVTDPPHGSAAINGTSVDYTPDADYFGPDSFDYTIQDADSEISGATVNVIVNEIDILPNAVDDDAVTDEDVVASIDVMANDDLGNTPTAIISAGPNTTNGGTAVVNDGGTPSDPSDDTVDYTPATNYSGTDSFPYTIEDKDGDQNTGTVNMSVNAVNDAPAFTSDPIVKLNAVIGEAYSGQTLAGDASDPENNTLTYSWIAGPTWLNVAGDGTLDGTPGPGDGGNNFFTVRVTDNGTPNEHDDATLSIFVESPTANEAPFANAGPDQTVADTNGAAGENVTLDGSGSSDSDGTIASYAWTWAGGSAGGVNPIVSLPDGTTVISLVVTDNDGAASLSDTVSITVAAPNVTPVANAGPDQSVPDTNGAAGENVTLDGSGSSDSDGTIASYAWTWAGGSAGGVNPIVSLPDGTTVISLVVTDNDGAASLSDTVSITVAAPVITPVHVGDLDGTKVSNGGRWDAVATITIHDGSEVLIAGATVNGSWSNGANGGGSCVTDASGQCGITKQNLKNNVASVDFTVTSVSGTNLSYVNASNHDPDGDSNGTTITVPPAAGGNLLPNAVDDSNTTTVDTPVNGNVLTNDDQGDAPATVTAFDAAGSPLGGTVSMSATGDYIYTPPAGVSGVDNFGYTITDNNGDTSNATVTITINANTGSVTAHVGDLTGASAAAPRNRWEATVSVTVHAADEAPVPGALVAGTWSSGANGSGSCTTDASGQCDITKTNVKGNVASVTFTVTDISGAGISAYDPAANHDPGNDGTVIVNQ